MHESPLLSTLLALAGLIVCGARGWAVEAPAARTLTLAEAQAIAERSNPGLAAERARIAIAKAETGRAAAWPSLDLSFEAARETPHDAVTLAIPIDAGRRRSWRIETAYAAVATAEAGFAASAAALRTEVRQAYFALAAAERRSATLADLVQLAERAAETADERFRSGDVPRLEAVQSQLGLAQAQADLDAARSEQRGAGTALAALLGFSPDGELKTADDLLVGAAPTAEEAMRQALATSSELALLDRRAAEQAARIELARALRIPSLTLQGAATFRAQPEFSRGWRAGVSLGIPSRSSGKAEVAIEQATLTQLQAERAAAERRIASTVAAAADRVAAAHERVVTLLNLILPQVEEVERMAEESYHAGQTALPAFLLALQTGREARLRVIQAGLDFQSARADLERSMGVPLP